MLGLKKKKERTDKSKATRGKIALTIIIAMTIFIWLTPNKKNHHEENDKDVITAMIDTHTDSLIRSLGYEDYEIYQKGQLETFTEKVITEEEKAMERLDTRIELLLSCELPPVIKETYLNEAYQQKEQLEKRIKTINSSPMAYMTIYSRRVKFKTPDGHRHVFHAQMFGKNYRTAHHADLEETRKLKAFIDSTYRENSSNR